MCSSTLFEGKGLALTVYCSAALEVEKNRQIRFVVDDF
jgi:hypothetical protein